MNRTMKMRRIGMGILCFGSVMLAPHYELLAQGEPTAQEALKFVRLLPSEKHDEFVEKIRELSYNKGYNEIVGSIVDIANNSFGLPVKNLDDLNNIIMPEFKEYLSVCPVMGFNGALVFLGDFVGKETKTARVGDRDITFYSTKIRNDKIMKPDELEPLLVVYNPNTQETVHNVDSYKSLAESIWVIFNDKDQKELGADEFKKFMPFFEKQWGSDIEQFLKHDEDAKKAKGNFVDFVVNQFIEDTDCRTAYVAAYGDENPRHRLNARLFQYTNGPLGCMNLLRDAYIVDIIIKEGLSNIHNSKNTTKDKNADELARERTTEKALTELFNLSKEIVNEFILYIRMQQRKGEYFNITSINRLDATYEQQVADLSKLTVEEIKNMAKRLYVGEMK